MYIFNKLLKLVNVSIIIVFIVFLFKWWIESGQQLIFSSKGNKVKEIDIEIVKKDKIREEIIAPCKITPDLMIMIKSKTSGIVKLLSCKEGDEIKEGEILCIIKDPVVFGESKKIEKALFYRRFKVVENYLRKTYSRNLETLESSKINYNQAFERYKQLQSLYQEGAVSKQELQESEIAYKRAKFQYNVAKSLFREGLEKTRIIAPFKGKIVLSNVKEGVWVEEGSELLLLADMSSLIAKIIIDEGEIEKVKIGQKVEITGETFAPYVLSGEIEKIGNYVVQTEQGLPGIEIICKIKKNEKINESLILNASAQARIIVTEKENALCIPSIALLASELQDSVFVVNNSRVHLRPVITGIISEDFVEVIDGLKEGERVVTIGNLNLKDGDWIKIKDESNRYNKNSYWKSKKQ